MVAFPNICCCSCSSTDPISADKRSTSAVRAWRSSSRHATCLRSSWRHPNCAVAASKLRAPLPSQSSHPSSPAPRSAQSPSSALSSSSASPLGGVGVLSQESDSSSGASASGSASRSRRRRSSAVLRWRAAIREACNTAKDLFLATAASKAASSARLSRNSALSFSSVLMALKVAGGAVAQAGCCSPGDPALGTEPTLQSCTERLCRPSVPRSELAGSSRDPLLGAE
mmetsp:Transcript_96038/g.255145  ORF Transcript_96038/g.255145 Transcript_96038/m.255145 type:complete len:227 (-) Transcript_96038:158-838(-)